MFHHGTKRPFWRLLAWFGWLLPLAGPSAATADEPDPYDTPVAPLRITQQEGEVGFEVDTLRESNRNIGPDTSFRNSSFEEYILYRMRGYVQRPDVLEFDASVKLGLLQQVIRNSGLEGDDAFASGNSHTAVGGYNFYLSFFKEHPLTFSLRARREREPVLELFTDRFLTESQEYGGTLRWDNKLFPMELYVGESRYKEWGFESQTRSTSKNLDYTIRNTVGRWMDTELRYHYQDYHQTFRADAIPDDIRQRLHLSSNDVSLANTIFLDPGRRSMLQSTLRYLSQDATEDVEGQGDSKEDIRDLNWQERLTLQHTDNLRTYYLLNYLHDQARGQSVSTTRGEIGLDHKLFANLEEHLDLHWRRSDFSSDSERVYGATGRLNYHKQTPWGLLSAGYSGTLDEVQHRGDGGVVLVYQESLMLRNGVNNLLSHPGVIVSSLVVTSPDRLTTYFEGFDFEVVIQGNRTGLRPLPFGRLTGGQTVHVDYNVEFTGNLHYTSSDQDLNLNYEFSKYLTGLAIYARWHDLNAHDAPKNDFSILSYRDKLAGFSYTWDGLTWREEYESYRSSFGNYNQALSQIEGLYAIGSRLKLGGHVSYLATDYKDGNKPTGADYDNLVSAGLTLRGAIRTNGYWEVQAEARRETGQMHETLRGLLSRLGFHWGKLRLEAGARAEERKRFDTRRDCYNVYLQIAREF